MASTGGKRQPVTLLAPSGREQPVILTVGREGVRLSTVEGKDINIFAYETIRKWLPSHLRSKNPGTDDCLDLQVETDRGPRDLRMRCLNATAVKQLMKDLRDTVESIMNEMEDRQMQQQEGQGDGAGPPTSENARSAQRPDSAATTRSNAETQTSENLTPSSKHQAPGSGVAQLFVAHPTGVALPVGSHGITAPVLMDGLQQATAPAPHVLTDNNTFAHDFLEEYCADGMELDVTDRASSAATGFYNAMFGAPVRYGDAAMSYGGMQGPHSPPHSPGMTSVGGPSSGGYYPRGFDMQAAQSGGPYGQPGMHMGPLPHPFAQHVPPHGYYVNGPVPGSFIPRPPPMQIQHSYPPPPPHPPLPRGGSARGMRTPSMNQPGGGRPPRRSEPASSSPVRRRVEFSGVNPGVASDSEVSSDVGGMGGISHYAHYVAAGQDAGGSGAGSGSSGSTGSGQEQGGGSLDGRGMGAAGSGGGAGLGEHQGLQLQLRFLEDLVARLSAEVSRRAVSPERATAAALALAGASDPGHSPAAGAAGAQQLQQHQQQHQQQPTSGAAIVRSPSLAPHSPAIDYEGLLSTDALGAAAVLRDQKLLTPLLAAYDTRISQLEADLRSRTEQVQALKGQVDVVVEENDRLRGDVSALTEARDAAQSQASTAAAAVATARNEAAAFNAAGAGNMEELELFRRENELLVTQQSELDEEIQRLHRQLQERSQEVLKVAQDQAALVAQAQQANAKAQEADARAAKLVESLRASEAKVVVLTTQIARTKAAADEASNAAAAHKAALDELRQVHVQLQVEATAAQQRYKVAADGAASLQLELSTQRERNDALQVQMSSLNRECDTLRSALGGVESKLTELQRKDADVWSRVKEAMSTAEEARLARDTAMARCIDLERQVDLANTRLNTVRQATRDAVMDEYNSQIVAAQATAAQVREELTIAHAAVSEWRARAERLERDQASLMSELAALREDTAAALASKSRLGLASLGAVEKVAALERERDDAIAKLESAQRKAERAARDWHLERQSVENTIRGLKSAVSELETQLSVARAEVSNSKRQVDSAQRELAAVKLARQQAELEHRQQISAMRAEREAEVRAFTCKLEAQAAAASAAAAEAERLLSTKQEVLARWREEAQTLASRMEAALAEHKRELAAKGHEAMELRSRMEALSAENVELAAAVSELEGKVDDLSGQLADADARADAAAAHAMGAGSREAELQHELRQLQALLDRSHFEKHRMQRANDPLTAKYDAVKKDIRQLTNNQQHPHLHLGSSGGGGNVVMPGWATAADAVVHATRVPPRGSQHPHHQHQHQYAPAPGR